MAQLDETTIQSKMMAKKSEIKVYKEFVLGSRNAVWYQDYITQVQRLEKEDPSLTEPGEMTKEQLKRKLAGFVAYR